jgi:eukaryotic-like serine/threonine-protein kinase
MIAAGTHLGPYEILAPLGAGGMGEVWRARDTRLNREVAIKVLPASLTNDEDRLRRFKQEALTTSALNHPNILTVHDFGTHEGSPYIVAELLEGEDLRRQLNDQALTPSKALDYAQQIAAGLAAAHEKGVVHRDLKPGNLFVTNDGRVKILDFGLAKLKPQPFTGRLNTEALTAPLDAETESGVIVGTVGYMSPEQVRGERVDHRSDIFSFGAILHEMLSGKRAFQRNTPVETMNAILKEEPPELSEIDRTVAPGIGRVMRRCLEKQPERRFQSASDLGFALEVLSTPSGLPLGTTKAFPAVTERASKRRLFGNAELVWIVAVVLLLGLLISLPFTIAHFRHEPMETQTSRFFVSPPEKSTLGTVTVSPDGRRLAFIARDTAGKTLLWLRPLDALTAQSLAGTDDAIYPFWSPDSRFIGFFADGKLKKVEVTGGPPSTLCNAVNGRGGAWSRDDVIIFAPDPDRGLSRISASGGEPSPLTMLDSSRGEESHRFPQFLPGGRRFLYFARSAQPENSAIYVRALDQPQPKRILSVNAKVAYSSLRNGQTGHLLFPREGALMAQAFDAESLELTGAPFRVAEHVGYLANNEAYFSVSDNGVLVYQSGGMAKTQLIWFDRSGKQFGAPGLPSLYEWYVLSPDEKRVAISRVDSQTLNADIWLLDLARGISSRFATDPAADLYPVWSPDGSRLVFASYRDGAWALYQRLSSGGGDEEALLKSSNPKWPSDWSKDGRFIIYDQISPDTQLDLWVLPLLGDRQPFPFLQTKFNERRGVFSPDARWIAYESDESGSYQVCVQSLPPGSKWQISSDGGEQPRWRRDGKELFYRAANGKLMAAEVKADASGFESSVPKPLFVAPTIDFYYAPLYAVTADGKRFLMNTPVEESVSAPITVVLNWTAELKK